MSITLYSKAHTVSEIGSVFMLREGPLKRDD
jgi:hypothetical protein